ncbi:hypothetical protein CBL_20113 [Carabus blaptoides fortunei]
MTCSRQEASRIQCAIDALRRGGPYTSKIKRILRLLRAQHQTLNLSTLTLLKQKTVDKIRALSLARKKLVNRVKWLEENSTFLSFPSRLFRQKPSFVVDDTENFLRALYEQEIPVQYTPALALFEDFCNSHLTDPRECPSVTAHMHFHVHGSSQRQELMGIGHAASGMYRTYDATLENEGPRIIWRQSGINSITLKRGVFQGDSLSRLLFCISLLPLSIELRREKGYMAGPPSRRKHKITYLFYMDDLKLYASNEKELKLVVDQVLEYTSAIGMRFGLDKCAVFHVRRGKDIDDDDDIHLVDGSIVKHLNAGGSYTFLGISERGVQELRKLYPGFTVKLVLIIGVLGDMKASCKQEIEIIPACRASVNSLLCRNQKAVLFGSLRIVWSLELC